MGEISQPWDGVVLGHATRAPYSADEWTDLFQAFFGSLGDNGVIPGVTNELEVTVTGANTVQVDTGEALVLGKWYRNDAAISINVLSSAGAWREDGIILRCDWAAGTITAVRKQNTTGDGVAWDSATMLTQTDGTTWEIPLAAARVDNVGAVTVTDIHAEIVGGSAEYDWVPAAEMRGSGPGAVPGWDAPTSSWEFDPAAAESVSFVTATPFMYRGTLSVWLYSAGNGTAPGVGTETVVWTNQRSLTMQVGSTSTGVIGDSDQTNVDLVTAFGLSIDQIFSIALTGDTPYQGSMVRWTITRLATHGSDDYTGDARVFGVLIKYG